MRWSAVAVALTASGWASAQQQGVTADEIRVGTIQDLSGPIAALGKQVRNGMQMRVDEINKAGGIHGRKIKLLVEDSGYDPKKAVMAAQKLVNQDKIFVMAGHIGTAPNMAAMPVQFAKNVINWMPITAAREMYEPYHKLKYSVAVPYYDQMRHELAGLVQKTGAKKICIIYQDDEYGLEVLRGAEAALKTMNQSLAEKTSFKRGATDFSSQVARMKSSECDFVVLGTILRETIGTIAEARKNGFNPHFFASQAGYTDLVHKLGGKAMDGLYAAMTVQHPYIDSSKPKIREWATQYKAQFGDEGTVYSVYGYNAIDVFVQAATKVGSDLSTETLIKTMDNNMSFPPDIFGMPELKFSATQRLGSDKSRLSQIVDGRWKVVSEYK
jgi:branched-chain amino acid transport system substrate-binding protein